MHSDDGTKIWPPPPEYELSKDGVSLVHTDDSNIVTVTKEFFVYAFFDSLEREDPKAADPMFHSSMRNVRCDDPKELWCARLDCVDAAYFNRSLEPLRQFYEEVRGEDLVNDKQNLTKRYWHAEERTLSHAKLVSDLFKEDRFRTMFYVANRTEESDTFFRKVIGNERWIGLGLVQSDRPPAVTLFHYDDEFFEAPAVWQVTSIYELTERRLNTLRHVFSLDFVSDAYIPPPPPPPMPFGTPTPTAPVTMGRRLAQQRPKKKPDTSIPLKKTNLKKTKISKMVRLRNRNPSVIKGVEYYLRTIEVM